MGQSDTEVDVNYSAQGASLWSVSRARASSGDGRDLKVAGVITNVSGFSLEMKMQEESCNIWLIERFYSNYWHSYSFSGTVLLGFLISNFSINKFMLNVPFILCKKPTTNKKPGPKVQVQRVV